MSDRSERSGVSVREVMDQDLDAIHAIYSYHVRHGLGSFEEVPPTLEEMTRRCAGTREAGLPYLVAVFDNVVVGYAYAGFFHPRSAYRFCLEDSVYVSHDAHGRGVGSALLAELLERCEQGPWRQMIALIGDSDNQGSIALHKRFGFTHQGVIEACGFKFGRWVDAVIMQRPLNEGNTTLPEQDHQSLS
ncbi:GNAT family N-acetyltransferase [Kushneria indalinina]|uniref:Phosphinothricin acetyltransferase n=1 Tax=Kushneria indalinina DSM 14324 TaxID=1122140 RepID=A0A3D9DWC0_9GAMM|nr:GNAT family N-acetyltransferase [Kushneria indalinina]REC95046.1 phosphinothricin acetyltransferase [Kushneria indalinina DSM 14324]